MRINIHDTTRAISYNQHVTLGYIRIDMTITKIVTGDVAISQNRHATLILGPPSRAPPNLESPGACKRRRDNTS